MKEFVACFLFFVVSTHATVNQDSYSTAKFYDHNNPLNCSDDKVFSPIYGQTFDIFTNAPNRQVKNLLVPLSGYHGNTSFSGLLFPSDTRQHLPIYFNLLEDGKNLGQYVLLEYTLHRINDGRDSIADFLDEDNNLPNKDVYIGASDGIFTYNPDTALLKKYGNLTEDILAIDKVSGKDIIYILTKDHKIYKVTQRGTVKTRVEGIDYANDFVLDFKEGIFYLGKRNKPGFLLKGATVPRVFDEFNFDVTNVILGRPLYGGSEDMSTDSNCVPYIVDGVAYIITVNQSLPVPFSSRVSGLTAFDAEFIFKQYYAVDGLIYVHDILAENTESVDINKRSSRKKTGDKKSTVAFERDLNKEYADFKKTFKL